MPPSLNTVGAILLSRSQRRPCTALLPRITSGSITFTPQQVGAQEGAAHLHAVAAQVIRRTAARQQRGHGPVPQRQDRVEGAVAQRQRTFGLAGNLALAAGVRDLERLGGLALLVEAAAAARRHEGGHGEE